MSAELSMEEERQVDELVEAFRKQLPVLETSRKNLVNLTEAPRLAALLHSVRSRVKDPEHLRAKLRRKLLEAKAAGESFAVDPTNLFAKVNDLIGVRLLHLHTTQFETINQYLLEELHEGLYRVVEGPTARVWDAEYREYFAGIGVGFEENRRMYTSVHYVVEISRRSTITAELQVRTLAEELWGEVDHTINYPVPSSRLACQEQIKVLARVTSSCTRLVDSIFRTHSDS